MFAWIAARRRSRLVAAPFPPHWDAVVRRNVAHFAHLPAPHQKTVRECVQVLVAEKVWEGAGGLHVTPEMPVTIAAQAALLMLSDRFDYFARVPSVVVYPDTFRPPDPDDWEEDEVAGGALDGVAADRGPVVLSWAAVLAEGRDPGLGNNLVVHEFAHQLDYLDGELNGAPPFPDRAARDRWRAAMGPAFAQHLADVRDTGESLFSVDAADPAEFFADACEAFVAAPHALRDDYPAVYAVLRDTFVADWAAWLPDAR